MTKKKTILTTRQLLYILSTLLLLAACSNDEGGTNVDNNGRVPLRIASGIVITPNSTTRAADDAWTIGDSIGLYAVTSYTTTPITDGSNVRYNATVTAATGGIDYKDFTPASMPVYMPTDGSAIDVYAYYPYASSATDATQVPISVADQTTPSAIDFMTTGKVSTTTHDGSTVITKANPTCELLFAHRLVKMQFNLKPGDGMETGDITNATVSVKIGNQPTTATYNIYTDAISIAAGSSDITPIAMATAATGYEKSFECIVLPNGTNNTAADRTVTITVQYQNETQTYDYTFTIGSGTSLVAGNRYVYNVTVNGYGIVVNDEKFTEQW